MTMLHCDSFDAYTSSELSTIYTGGFNGYGSIEANGRFGNRFHGAQNGTGINKTIPDTGTIIIGFAFMTNTGSTNTFVYGYETGGQHFRVGLDSIGRVVVYHGNNTLLATGVTPWGANVWHYFEIKIKIHSTTGTIEVRRDGNVEIAATGLNTRNGGAAGVINQVLLVGGGGNDPQAYFDDYVICDTNGSLNNDFLGDVRVSAIFPTGAGNSTQFTPSAGANYAAVDEVSPNGDTDYVESSNVGDKDTYVYGDLPSAAGIVKAVRILPYAKKTDAGGRTIVSVARLGGTEVDSASKGLSTTYAYLPDIRETKPGGGTWSITDVNNTEFGIKVDA